MLPLYYATRLLLNVAARDTVPFRIACMTILRIQLKRDLYFGQGAVLDRSSIFSYLSLSNCLLHVTMPVKGYYRVLFGPRHIWLRYLLENSPR